MRPALVPILLADPMPWAFKAPYAWDFLRDRARFAGGYKGALANTPNWTSSPATHSGGLSTYASKLDGSLQAFASGAFRRTDRGSLIEGSGTNLCLQSQTFDNASWTKSRTSISANAIAAPDGTTTADKLVEDGSATNSHRTFQSVTTTAVATTFSVYAKAAERSILYLRINRSDTTTPVVWFDLSAGTVGTAQTGLTGRITALANGWYRCAATVDAAQAGSNSPLIGLATSDNSINYDGDGTSGLYLWGAQLEATAYASSYVPTTTGSATRAADSLTVTGVTGTYPLTLYAEFEPSSATGVSQEILQLDDSTSNERSLLRRNSSGPAIAVSVAGGVTQATPTSAANMNVGTTYKLAARFATDSVRLALSAVLATEDTSATNPASPNTIRFGTAVGGGSPAYGYIRRAAIFSRALSDGELQALTA